MTDEYDIAAMQPPDDSNRPDPVGRTLMIVALLLLIAVVGVGAGMVLYLREGFDLPRSAAERDVAIYEVAVRESPEDQANHVQLASAYARAGRTDLAMESILLARQIGDNPTVDLAEAQVLFLSGDHEGALALFQTAEEGALAEFARAEEEMFEQGISFPMDKTVIIRATSGQAEVLWELERPDEAIAAIQRALQAAPEDASLYALLGDYLAQTGDPEGAQEAYLAALRFVPDHPQAVAGLRELEGASGE